MGDISFAWGLSFPLPFCPSLSVWQTTRPASRDGITQETDKGHGDVAINGQNLPFNRIW